MFFQRKNDLELYDGTCLHNVVPSKYKLFNEKNYLKWAEDNYRELSDGLSHEEKTVLSEYCKQDIPFINQVLRGRDTKIFKINKEIEILRNITTKRKLDENILVYKVSNRNWFEKDNIYLEKGFMSTSLIDGYINTIHLPWEYKYIILVNRNCCGFYADFISCRYGEFELLLPCGLRVKRINEYKDSNEKKIVLCKVVGINK